MAPAEAFTLYHYRQSICSLMVRYIFAASSTFALTGGTPYMTLELQEVDIFKNAHLEEYYLCDVNPRGQIIATDELYGLYSLFRGYNGCLGSTIVKLATEYTKTNNYYIVRHFLRFIQQGAVNYIIAERISRSVLILNQLYITTAKNLDNS